MYAILDIETTGGAFNEEGITEIAIYRFDGHEITDQFISLINPEIPIQPFVVKLTGINNAMLRSAPKFFEVAKRILEITEGCIMVAHNAPGDYRLLRNEFRRLGYDFQIHTLCTVELAQKLLPEQPAYSLGKLVRALGLPIADRHRATGDAMATLKLFKLLLAKDTGKEIARELVRTELEKGLEPKLFELTEALPSRTGVYYVHREDGSVLYVGRSKNMRKHLTQHFTGTSRISKRITSEIFTVTYDETGSELVAILKEIEEIRVLKPACNRLKKKPFQWGAKANLDANGFAHLEVVRADARKGENPAFLTENEGISLLLKMASVYGICKSRIKGTMLEECDDVPLDEYNTRVDEVLQRINFRERNVLLIDRGRTINERTAIWVDHGVLRGYAFYDLNFQIKSSAILKNILVALPNSRDTYGILASNLLRNRKIKIVQL